MAETHDLQVDAQATAGASSGKPDQQHHPMQIQCSDQLTPEAIEMQIRAEHLAQQGAARGLSHLFNQTK